MQNPAFLDPKSHNETIREMLDTELHNMTTVVEKFKTIKDMQKELKVNFIHGTILLYCMCVSLFYNEKEDLLK